MDDPSDIFIIGGGINGCGIARDAAGRGLSVTLAEMDDLASATSSASTKLFHGGLRYLEYMEFRLVREALQERETLLTAMPHISKPMRFIIPYHADMRFESDTPISRLLGFAAPWMKGQRPAWLIRLALWIYDRLGGPTRLPRSRAIALTGTAEGAPLQDRFRNGFEYSDCWVDDARLVMLNARDAAARGARILTRTKVVRATRENGLWRIETRNSENGQTRVFWSRGLINAAGPWVAEVIQGALGTATRDGVRLVRGSHIVTRKLFDHDKSYFFQGTDGRIIFAIPYETDFTLIGTTDADHPSPAQRPTCTPQERDYLLNFANQYFQHEITADDVVHSYSGVRPLFDDGADSATAATRDYVIKLDTEGGAPLLNIFGGKITTYRRLAETALTKLGPHLGMLDAPWTARSPLPGGDFPVEGFAARVAELRADYPFLSDVWAQRLVRSYGAEARDVLGDARRVQDLGEDFGATLSEAELRWMIKQEFARTAEDVLWRRSKLGLRLSDEQVGKVAAWMADYLDPTNERAFGT